MYPDHDPEAVGHQRLVVREETHGGNETILLIDDDVMVAATMKQLLLRLGYNVLLAHDADEALRTAHEHEGAIHLAILDIMMPGMRGDELYPLFHAERPETRVLVMSGYQNDDAVQRLLAAGVSGFLPKPARFAQLAQAVRDILRPGDWRQPMA